MDREFRIRNYSTYLRVPVSLDIMAGLNTVILGHATGYDEHASSHEFIDVEYIGLNTLRISVWGIVIHDEDILFEEPFQIETNDLKEGLVEIICFFTKLRRTIKEMMYATSQ
jgi:hypothetical protein